MWEWNLQSGTIHHCSEQPLQEVSEAAQIAPVERNGLGTCWAPVNKKNKETGCA